MATERMIRGVKRNIELRGEEIEEKGKIRG